MYALNRTRKLATCGIMFTALMLLAHADPIGVYLATFGILKRNIGEPLEVSLQACSLRTTEKITRFNVSDDAKCGSTHLAPAIAIDNFVFGYGPKTPVAVTLGEEYIPSSIRSSTA
jgi:hypothetical protein